MKFFSTHLFAISAVAALSLAGNAFACGGGGNRGGGNRGGGNGGGYVNNNLRNNQSCNNGSNSNPYNQNYGQAYEPFHSNYFVQPGDTFYTVSLKEYGTSSAAPFIARYNRMAPNAALTLGQQLMLPSISATGQLTQSRAPAAGQFAGSQPQIGPTTQNFTQLPTSTVAESVPAASEPERPSVPTGSVIKLDGQALGATQGVVRLKISNVALPVEVVEWTAEATTVRLPKIDVNGPTKAEVEVLRADGSLAATNAIELTTVATGLARN